MFSEKLLISNFIYALHVLKYRIKNNNSNCAQSRACFFLMTHSFKNTITISQLKCNLFSGSKK